MTEQACQQEIQFRSSGAGLRCSELDGSSEDISTSFPAAPTKLLNIRHGMLIRKPYGNMQLQACTAHMLMSLLPSAKAPVESLSPPVQPPSMADPCSSASARAPQDGWRERWHPCSPFQTDCSWSGKGRLTSSVSFSTPISLRTQALSQQHCGSNSV